MMKTQVLVIHGGNVFNSYVDFLHELRSKEINIERMGSVDWKQCLQRELGSNYQVLLPRMPNRENAKYVEWKIWFERFVPLLHRNVILIGHSLGGAFLMKYLATEQSEIEAAAVLIVAAPYDRGDRRERLPEFGLSSPPTPAMTHTKELVFYHSKDDPVVPFSELLRYQTAMPAARFVVLDGRGHFNEETFPELVNDIRKVINVRKWHERT